MAMDSDNIIITETTGRDYQIVRHHHRVRFPVSAV